MIKIIALAVVLLLAIILIYAASKPDKFHVERSIDIKAPPEKIFGLINDFRQWDAWTPYNKDPAMKKTYSANTIGKGAHYAWEGNKEVGQGEIAITDTTPPKEIEMELHMIKPFEGRNHVVFSIDAAGSGTQVTWVLEDQHTYFLKVLSMFINMDKMIGNDFETGLARLKVAAEK
ncbi:MAG: SRPBCC family protein [Gammaproteobacteria bacterium]|nr:SRPBCC family protein [Gammaproteobacteria bacterium]MBU1776363.1 SRPBCC family protein [Gammaproteobacteria bacterium]MBU1967924.1 SRPBCC family protein [Gammaproteobacteria bacterium]